MRVLVTGHDGYIGRVLVPLLHRAGIDVVGLDTFYFDACTPGNLSVEVPRLRKDIRDVTLQDLHGFDAVVHLAALSNDAWGDINPTLTFQINHLASVRLAEMARSAAVKRFVFSSSCSLYGDSGPNDILAETDVLRPLTPYSESKVRAEVDIGKLADDCFSPIFLRNATAYGWSPSFRADLVLNDFVGWAYTTGQIRIKSDGTSWRPLVHVEDIARAVLAVLRAPRERIHNEAFNVGSNEENYQIRDLAILVGTCMPGSELVFAAGGGPDKRSYRVDFTKVSEQLPAFTPRWTVQKAIQQLCEAFSKIGMTLDDLAGSRFSRIKRILESQQKHVLDAQLRWQKSEKNHFGDT